MRAWRSSLIWTVIGLGLAFSAFRYGVACQEILARGFDDFPVFWDRAHLYLTTGVLYPDAEDATYYRPSALVFKYPPLYVTLLLPLVRLGVGPAIYPLHWLFQITLFVVTAIAIASVFPVRDSPRYLLAMLILALNFEPFFETLHGLQVETLLLLVLLGALLGVLWRRPWLAGSAVALAGMLKVYPGLLALYFVARRRWADAIATAVALAVMLVVLLFSIGVRDNVNYFFHILPAMSREIPLVMTQNVGFGRYLQTILDLDPFAAKQIGSFIGIALLGGSLLAVWRDRRPDTADYRTTFRFLLFVPLALLLLPNSWTNYQLLLLVPYFALFGYCFAGGRRRAAVAPVTALAYAFTLVSENTTYVLSTIHLSPAWHGALLGPKILSSLLPWLTMVWLVLDRDPGPQFVETGSAPAVGGQVVAIGEDRAVDP